MAEKNLHVYFNERLAGTLTQYDNHHLSFTYHPAYRLGGQAISHSLPLQESSHQGQPVFAFFSGLLPDDEVRHRLARVLGLSEKNPFSLLKAIGGECAGALSIVPAGEVIEACQVSDNTTLLSETELSSVIASLKKRPLLAGEEGFRLSLAGAQEKLAVTVIRDQIALVGQNQPTSHILKPAIAGITDSVCNEFFCMQLAKRIGITTPKTLVRQADGEGYFLVERYDRVHQGANLVRLHQEDFCQAIAIAPDNKYQREGGPSIKQCVSLIEQSCRYPARDKALLIERIIFNYLIVNLDAHGKNFSLLYNHQRPSLAPAYDLLSTEIYPELTQKMAMKIGSKYKPEEVLLRHFHSLVADTATAKKELNKQLKSISARTLFNSKELEGELSHTHPSPIYAAITKLITKHCDKLMKQLF